MKVDVDVDVNEMPLFRAVHTLIFTYVPYIVNIYSLNFYREKQSIAFVAAQK